MLSLLISALAALSAFRVSHAITINTPSDWKSDQPNTVTWTSAQGDPDVFTIQLRNDLQFNSRFALANNVPTSSGSAPIALPPLADYTTGFTLEFVNITDINAVYATSSSFMIEQQILPTSATSTAPPNTATDPLSTGSLTRSTLSTGTGSLTRTTGTSTGTSTGPNASSTNAAIPIRLQYTNSLWVLAGLAGLAM